MHTWNLNQTWATVLVKWLCAWNRNHVHLALTIVWRDGCRAETCVGWCLIHTWQWKYSEVSRPGLGAGCRDGVCGVSLWAQVSWSAQPAANAQRKKTRSVYLTELGLPSRCSSSEAVSLLSTCLCKAMAAQTFSDLLFFFHRMRWMWLSDCCAIECFLTTRFSSLSVFSPLLKSSLDSCPCSTFKTMPASDVTKSTQSCTEIVTKPPPSCLFCPLRLPHGRLVFVAFTKFLAENLKPSTFFPPTLFKLKAKYLVYWKSIQFL